MWPCWRPNCNISIFVTTRKIYRHFQDFVIKHIICSCYKFKYFGDLNKCITQSLFSAVVSALFALGVALLVASQDARLERYIFLMVLLLSCVVAMVSMYLITIHFTPSQTPLQGKYRMKAAIATVWRQINFQYEHKRNNILMLYGVLVL